MGLTTNVIRKLIDPVFLDFEFGRKAMKDKYGVDFFIANAIEGDSGKPFVEFFQKSSEEKRKGIVLLELDKETL